MSKYFAMHHVTEEFQDLTWRKHGQPGWYVLWWGEQRIGLVMKTSRGTWSATATEPFDNETYGMDGFTSRWYASEWILKTTGIWCRWDMDHLHERETQPCIHRRVAAAGADAVGSAGSAIYPRPNPTIEQLHSRH